MKKIVIFIGIILLLTARASFAATLGYYGKITSTVTISSPPVVINEIGYRGGPKDEFVELHNLSSNPIDLNGWKIQDNTQEDKLSPFEEGGLTEIPNGGYAVITATPTDVIVPEGVVHLSTGDKKIGNGLDDGDDIVILKNPDGNVIDQKEYSQNPCKGKEKPSYQKVNGDWECNVPSPGASNI